MRQLMNYIERTPLNWWLLYLSWGWNRMCPPNARMVQWHAEDYATGKKGITRDVHNDMPNSGLSFSSLMACA